MTRHKDRDTRGGAAQKTFDFSARGGQLQLLAKIQLSRPMLKTVLRAIDDCIGKNRSWQIPYSRLAEMTGSSRGTVCRVVKELAQLYLIDVTKRVSVNRETGARQNLPSEFRITWSNLPDFLPQESASSDEIVTEPLLAPAQHPSAPAQQGCSPSATPVCSGAHNIPVQVPDQLPVPFEERKKEGDEDSTDLEFATEALKECGPPPATVFEGKTENGTLTRLKAWWTEAGLSDRVPKDRQQLVQRALLGTVSYARSAKSMSPSALYGVCLRRGIRKETIDEGAAIGERERSRKAGAQ